MIKNHPVRILYVGVAPIQNTQPFRLLTGHTEFSATVIYLKRPEANADLDKESITKAAFDIDLVSGYSNHFLKTFNLAKRGFFSLISFGIIKWVRGSDIIVIYGHYYFTFWLAMLAAKLFSKKLVQTTDAVYMEATAESGGWKMKIKPSFLRWLYNRFVDGLFVTSTTSKLFLKSIGINENKMVVIPYAVDEEMIKKISAATDVAAFRARLNIPMQNTVFIFCAKFISRKRPMDAIEAFSKLTNRDIKLIMIGDGPLKDSLTQRVKELNMSDKIIFPGLVPYSKLAGWYTASDALVFCSEHEPYGLPVNEAMLCGIPVIVSDRIGSRMDLVEEGITGWVYRTGDINQLSERMNQVINLKRQGSLQKMGEAAKIKMTNWSSETNLQNQLNFFKQQNWVG